MKKIVVLLMLVSSISAYSQSINLYDLDASAFPTIKAKFYAYDASGTQQRPTASGLSLTENGTARTITNVSCPAPIPPKALSSVLVIDVSGSMDWGPTATKNIDLAKSAARAWVNALPLGQSECAISSFDNANYLNQDFTTDRNKLLNAIIPLQPYGGTDYDEALINPMAGGLLISKNGKHQKVIIFLTDGSPWQDPNVNLIVNEATKQNCIIYCVTLGMLAPQSVRDIAKRTGGEYFENVTTIKEAEEVYRKILQSAQGGEPCDIVWESGVTCSNNKTNVELKWNSATSTNSYNPPPNTTVKLEIKPSFVAYGPRAVGSNNDTTITLTAYNTDFEVQSIVPKYGNSTAITIVGATYPISIPKNTSKSVTLRFAPTDSSLQYMGFEVITNHCINSFSASAGFRNKKIAKSTLKLTHPNGGELFVVGSDTIITWEGIAPSDTVVLDYSTDNGSSWINITTKATGLSYNWKSIPKPASNQCLVRVGQGQILNGNYDPNDIAPKIIWQKTYGGDSTDEAASIIESSDGNYVVVGRTISNNGDITENKGYFDYWVIKVNSNDGSIIWQKTYGGSDSDYANDIIESSDGNYVVAGETSSDDGDIIERKNDMDYWLIKINSNDGSIIWQKTYGGSGMDYTESVIECSDGNYVVVGYSYSNNGDKTESKGDEDYWVIKINSNDGSIIWQKTYGGSNWEHARDIIESSDGNYVVAGVTMSNNGDITENKGSADYWLIKINSNDGSIIWQKTYGGSISDYANDIIESSDGNYVVAGETSSNNGDITENKGNADNWLIKINSNDGSIIWQKSYGGSNLERANDIIESSDGNYVVVGWSISDDGDITENKGNADYWLIKINSNDGSIIWQKTYGGSEWDQAYDIIESSDGKYVVASRSSSDDGDITENKGDWDYSLIKIEEAAPLESDQSDAVFTIVEPIAKSSNIDMLTCLVGAVKDSLVSNFVRNTGSYPFTVDSIYFRGADATAFKLVSGIPEYSVTPGKGKFGEFRFLPNRVGLHQADIVIITQADTLIQTIKGTGVQAQLAVIGEVVDFGQVAVNKSKDSLQVVTIKNIGTAPLSITNTKHDIPNITDFTTLAGGGSFTLNPDETAKLDLRFTPSEVGRTSGQLQFLYNGVGSPAVVQLFGEGIKTNPSILATSETFVDLVCDTKDSIEITILNNGGEDLVLSELNLTGTHPTDFNIISSYPIIIQPDSSEKILLEFTPSNAGIKSANLEIKSNADPDSLLSLPLSGKKDNLILSISNSIDLGLLCPDETKNFDFTITNSGTINSVVSLTSESEIVLSNSELTIISNANDKQNGSFTGISTEGTFTRKIIITDTLCNTTLEVDISGEVAKAYLQADDLTLSSGINIPKSGLVRINNPSKHEIDITDIQGILAPFELDGIIFPIKVSANSFVDIPVKFTPVDTNGTTIDLFVFGTPCSVLDTLTLSGSGSQSSISNRVPTYSGLSGETIIIAPIITSKLNIEESGVTSLKGNFYFNPTLLYPLDYTMVQVDDTSAYIELTNLPTDKSIGDAITEIKFRVGLGNAEESSLRLGDMQAVGGLADISVEDGNFKLLGICYEGGTRLLNPNKRAGIQSIVPNPAENIINVRANLTEKGKTEILIYNITGEIVKTIYSSGTTTTGLLDLSIDLNELSNGAYTVVLVTPTYVNKANLIIAK